MPRQSLYLPAAAAVPRGAPQRSCAVLPGAPQRKLCGAQIQAATARSACWCHTQCSFAVRRSPPGLGLGSLERLLPSAPIEGKRTLQSVAYANGQTMDRVDAEMTVPPPGRAFRRARSAVLQRRVCCKAVCTAVQLKHACSAGRDSSHRVQGDRNLSRESAVSTSLPADCPCSSRSPSAHASPQSKNTTVSTLPTHDVLLRCCAVPRIP